MKPRKINAATFERLIPAGKREVIENYIRTQINFGIEQPILLARSLSVFVASMESRHRDDDEWQQIYALFLFPCLEQGLLNYVEQRFHVLRAFQETGEPNAVAEAGA